MAQHIGIVKINEKGDILKQSKYNFAPIIDFLYQEKNYKTKFPMLSKIDLYGDTRYTSVEIAEVINELKRFKDLNDNVKTEIDDIICFIENLQPQDFIEFIGD